MFVLLIMSHKHKPKKEKIGALLREGKHTYREIAEANTTQAHVLKVKFIISSGFIQKEQKTDKNEDNIMKYELLTKTSYQHME